MTNTPQACRAPQGRTRGVIEGNAADDASLVDQGFFIGLTGNAG
jgi:hypothetical protein